MVRYCNAVRAHRGEGVVPVGCPFAFAVTSQIERDRSPSLRGDDLGGLAPRVSCLSTSVKKENRPRVSIASRVGDKIDAFKSLERDAIGLHGSRHCSRGKFGQ